MIYFTSDLHFGHANIIKYCNRPFASAEEMDAQLIKNWNDMVKKDDIVYVLGDLTKIEDKDVINSYLSKLEGRKIFILGNHDEYIRENYKELLFEEVVEYKEIAVDGTLIVLCHYPILEWNKKNKGSICLHGHTHNHSPSGCGIERLFDVGVDANGFKPVSVNEIFKEINV